MSGHRHTAARRAPPPPPLAPSVCLPSAPWLSAPAATRSTCTAARRMQALAFRTGALPAGVHGLAVAGGAPAAAARRADAGAHAARRRRAGAADQPRGLLPARPTARARTARSPAYPLQGRAAPRSSCAAAGSCCATRLRHRHAASASRWWRLRRTSRRPCDFPRPATPPLRGRRKTRGESSRTKPRALRCRQCAWRCATDTRAHTRRRVPGPRQR
jgi:hypothetical protein